MKTFKIDQSEARGYFRANRKNVVIEFILPGQEEPLEITGSRGRPISNKAALKRLDQLAGVARFKNRSVTDLGYQKFLFDGFNSYRGEYHLGFLRFIPEGQEEQVQLQITECDSVIEAKTVSKYLRDTKLSKNRAIRREVPLAKNTVKNLRMVGVEDHLVVDSGTARNLSVKFG